MREYNLLKLYILYPSLRAVTTNLSLALPMAATAAFFVMSPLEEEKVTF